MGTVTGTLISIIGIIAVVIAVMTLIGALILWILGHFMDFEFSWILAFAIGLVFSMITGGLNSRRS